MYLDREPLEVLKMNGLPTEVTELLGQQRASARAAGPHDSYTILLQDGSGLLATV